MPDERGAGTAGSLPDTIFAPASGAGRAAIAVIRISGPAAHRVVRDLTGKALPGWRRLALRAVRSPEGEVIDRAMVVAFPDGASYTGEAMAEIHCHGGRAVVSGVLDCLARQRGCRLADPGEFTRRALLHGRMDLSEVEGLSDLISAETAAQRRQALRVSAGAVSRQTEGWRRVLLRARALIEATIDWADEDVPEDVGPQIEALLTRLAGEMDAELARAGPAERMRAGLEAAIIGPPNVGKSSLLNAIAGREAAIVSATAGTTRDVLEVRVDLQGLPVIFLDTAGLRHGGDEIEAIGVDRARRRAAAADLRLFLRSPDEDLDCGTRELRQEGDLDVWTKSDLGPGAGDVLVSVLADTGIDALLHMVAERLAPRAESAGVLSTARQRLAVERARAHIGSCLERLGGAEDEMVAEESRLAVEALDRLVGRIGVEDVLGEIFASFCMGK